MGSKPEPTQLLFDLTKAGRLSYGSPERSSFRRFRAVVRGEGFEPTKALWPQDLKFGRRRVYHLLLPLRPGSGTPARETSSNKAIKLAPSLVGPTIDRTVLLAPFLQLLFQLLLFLPRHWDHVVPPAGFEPASQAREACMIDRPTLQGHHFNRAYTFVKGFWRARGDSNPGFAA